jgi:drug/metabolite transporter (DMT)-like permease
MTRAQKALLVGALANILGATTYLGQKIAMRGFTPAVLICLRMLIALPLLFYFAERGWTKRATRSDWIRMTVVGVFGLAIPHLIGVHGLKETDSVYAALLVGVEPVAIVLMSALWLGERIVRPQVIGMAIAILGAILVVSKGDFSGLTADPATRGNLLLVVASIFWGIYTIAAKPTLERVPPLAVAGVASSISLLILIPAALLEMPLDLQAAKNPVAIGAVILLGLFISFGATVMWNVSLKDIPASQMATLIFIQPVAGTLLGVVYGDELRLASFVGGALVLGGVYVIHWPAKQAGTPG